jgi:protocatechuate 3,4-dioxygenase beta subunit
MSSRIWIERRAILAFWAFAIFVWKVAVADEPASRQEPGRQPAVLRGRVTNEAGERLTDVRVRVAIAATDMRFVDETTGHKLRETRTDARGEYRLELPDVAMPTKVSLDAMKPGYRRLVGTGMAGGDPIYIEVAPGKVAEASMKLKPALYFRGVVVDEQGKPLAGVRIASYEVRNRFSGSMERLMTRSDGSFELFCYPTRQDPISTGPVLFTREDYVSARIADVYALEPKNRDSIRVVLPTGFRVSGRVIDESGKPVAKALVKAILKDGGHRKAVFADEYGQFTLRGLSGGLTMLTARGSDARQLVHLPLAMKGDRDGLELRLRPVLLPAGLVRYSVLGMQLADVTPELKEAYDLFRARGVLVLDPGKNVHQLNLGDLTAGHVFSTVGRRPVNSVREFVDSILAEPARGDILEVRVQVVSAFVTYGIGFGSSAALMRLTKEQRQELQALAEQLRTDFP